MMETEIKAKRRAVKDRLRKNKPRVKIGDTFGKLTVIGRLGTVPNGASATPLWQVRCAACDGVSGVAGSNIRKQVTCGCAFTKHGMFGTPEYSAWVSMIQRCENPKARSFPNYGARGISVAPEWKSFDSFFVAMGARPSDEHSLDRRDNNGNYEPSNCRWATRVEQARNKRCNRRITVGVATATIAEWAEATGIGVTTIRERLQRGWSPARAVGLEDDVEEYDRPQTRAECPTGPCGFLTCRHHMALSFVGPGTFTFENVPRDSEGNPDILAMRETCSLRAAEAGVRSHEDIADMLGADRQRIEQIEADALVKLTGRRKAIDEDRTVYETERLQVVEKKRGAK